MAKVLSDLVQEIKSALSPLFVKRTRGGWIFLGVLAVFFISDRFDSVSSLFGKIGRSGPALKFVIEALQMAPVQVVLFLIGCAWIGIACYLAAPKEPILAEEKRDHFDPNNAFKIDALAVPNLQNLTEVGQDMEGKAPWSLDCEISVTNLHPTQGLGDVTFRIIGISPPMVARPAHHPRTQDTTLRRVRFGFADLPTQHALAGDQTGHIRIFQASKHIMFSEAIKESPGKVTEVFLAFDGVWPDNLKREFAPVGEYRLTVEVTGSGVRRREDTFRLFFSPELDKPVFTVAKLSGVPDLAFRKRRALYEATATCLAKAPPMQFAGLKCLQDARADTLETSDDLVWVCDNLVRDGYEHPFYHFDEHIQPSRWLIFLVEARKSGIDFADDMATLMWFMKTHP